MADNDRNRQRSLTHYERRVMEYFVKDGGSRAMRKIVNGVEGHLPDIDALFEPEMDLYSDRTDIEAAVRSLVGKGLLKEIKIKNETCYRARLTRTHVRNCVRSSLTKMGQSLSKLGHIRESPKAVLIMVAAAVSIITNLLGLWNP